MNTIYQTKAVATGGRDGKVVSEDGVLNLDVRVPKSMGGAGGAYTNPEQLFAAGYAACFDSALNHIARLERKKIQSKVTATVGLQMEEATGFNIIVTMDVEITGVEKSVAQELLAKAHATCPYSKAIRNNVEVTLNLVEA
ncbi:organic hydroperoxide resistance protein [Williamwhitmania taraxaci]|uniref:Peroxiredoxin, Ohr subfamily n=1 Tax=Williamwhitmania taraxaci TaxID=1640674 RepID=A0A1G6QLZ6_9BACT|nr:organic hydroperoxide resistance protein [Williamwhitmania taraxaci]SDC93389.1 peroxiredoxin, Ohr subfamily [Williamwhitmania taraxaci]